MRDAAIERRLRGVARGQVPDTQSSRSAGGDVRDLRLSHLSEQTRGVFRHPAELARGELIERREVEALDRGRAAQRTTSDGSRLLSTRRMFDTSVSWRSAPASMPLPGGSSTTPGPLPSTRHCWRDLPSLNCTR